jgi:hypothetical protein
MRFTKKLQLNAILKISFKSLIVLLILLTFALDLGIYISELQKQGWIINWDGNVVVFGHNYGLFVSNYLISFSVATHLFSLLYLILGIVNHKKEAKGHVQSYSVGLFILLSELFNMCVFLFVTLPTSENISHLPWPSIVFSKILIPILMFLYIMVFMENKSWYGVIETILRVGFRISSIFVGVIIAYWMIWLSKYIGGTNENILMLKSNGISDDEFMKNMQNVTGIDNLSRNVLDYIGPNWNNHDAINMEPLFRYSGWDSAIVKNVGEWIGVVIAVIIFTLLSFAILPALAVLNNKVVNSPRYLVISIPNENAPQSVDLRDDVDTIDLTPISIKRNDDID